MTAQTEDPGFWSARSKRSLCKDEAIKKAWGGSLPNAYNLGTLLDKELPPSVPVIAPWLHSGESCLLYGGTGSGKSMVALTLALAAAGGGEALGWTFPKPTRVLFVDGEQSERDLQRRVVLLSTSIQGFDSETAKRNLVFMPRSAQDGGTGFLDIANPAQADLLAAEVGRQGIGLVVFDNLSTLTDSLEDENSAAAFKPMQTLLTRLKKGNVAVVLVHHTGKNQERGFRGSSSIATTFERVLGVVHNEAVPATQLDVTVRLEKFRDEVPAGFQPVFPLVFSVKEEGPGGGRVACWAVGRLSELEDSWRMFSRGEFTTKKAFVGAFNEKYDATRSEKNFGRDFCKPWMAKLHKSAEEIGAAEQRMKDLQSYDNDESAEDFTEESAAF